MFQDGTFSLADFTDAYQENEVQRVIRAYENSISIDIHCSTGGGEWHKLPDMPFVKHCKIRVNPTDILDSGSQAIKDFISKYLLIVAICIKRCGVTKILTNIPIEFSSQFIYKICRHISYFAIHGH